MTISLITISFNNACGLRRTLASVHGQELPCDVEHIIVDGMSSDGSREILDAAVRGDFDRTVPSGKYHVRVMFSEPRGVYNALNVGLKASTGNIIGMLHAGDAFAAPDILAAVAGAFDNTNSTSSRIANPLKASPFTRDVTSFQASPDFVFGDIHYARAVSGTVGCPWEPGNYRSAGRYYSGRYGSLKSVLNGYAPPHPSLYMSRKCLEKVGLYKEDYKTAADFEMFVRLFCNRTLRFSYIARDMVCMEPGGMSASWRSRLRDNNRERMRAFRENGIRRPAFAPLLHYIYMIKSQLWQKIK